MLKAEVPYQNGTRKLSKEEWLILADYENDMQDNKHVATKIFNVCMVCSCGFYVLIHSFYYLELQNYSQKSYSLD
jgi:hypothetical protein